jgi:aspartate aminotransferase
MLPSHSPKRVARAHDSLTPIFKFLGQYDKWLANADDNYCDFALGNPQTMPSKEFVSTLRDAATPQSKDWYAYKMSEPSSRDIVRASLRELTQRTYAPEDIFLTNGATGALLVTMNGLIEVGDEAIYSNPPWFFYEGMILNCGGVPVPVSVDPSTYNIDLVAIENAITERTRLVIVNSPHNPTGKVYSTETLRQLASILEVASQRHGRKIYLVSDEAYRSVVYDGLEFVSPTNFYRNSIMIYTYGKTLLTPGQRIGYIALSPEIEEREELRTLMASSQILCGWAMSSALMQHGLRRLQTLSPDVADLQKRRDRLVGGLRDCGYEVKSPEGAFYVMPKTPIADDAHFVELLSQHGVFCLPGHIVKMPGHLRMSVTASNEMIEQALPILAAVRAGLEA